MIELHSTALRNAFLHALSMKIGLSHAQESYLSIATIIRESSYFFLQMRCGFVKIVVWFLVFWTLKRLSTHLATCTRRKKSIWGSCGSQFVDFGGLRKVDFSSQNTDVAD